MAILFQDLDIKTHQKNYLPLARIIEVLQNSQGRTAIRDSKYFKPFDGVLYRIPPKIMTEETSQNAARMNGLPQFTHEKWTVI